MQARSGDCALSPETNDDCCCRLFHLTRATYRNSSQRRLARHARDNGRPKTDFLKQKAGKTACGSARTIKAIASTVKNIMPNVGARSNAAP